MSSGLCLEKNRRVLVVDDNAAIHADFKKILTPKRLDEGFEEEERSLFQDMPTAAHSEPFSVDFSLQGQDALAKVCEAVRADQSYALAFVDVRMPPGWDGIETSQRLWKEDPYLQIVLCTAYSDYSWSKTIERLGLHDRLLFLKKPFETVEARQLAWTLTEKWNLARRARLNLQDVQSLVETRTEELKRTTQALASAREAAEQASRCKSSFLARMSHELRTPMTAILGYAECLLDAGVAESERREHAETILRNGQYLLTLINDILDFSKLESETVKISRVPCDVREVVRSVHELLRGKAAAKGLELRVDIEPSLPPVVYTDAVRLRQILLNLVGNALHFTPSGSVRLAVGASGHQAGRIRFDVFDTGIGMTAEQSAKIFQPFEQGCSSIGRRFGGTGLGLSISRRLAQLLGGDIEIVTTRPGRGSHFRACIDFQPPPAAPIEEEPAMPKPAEVTPPRVERTLIGMRVLLAEDSPDSAKLIQHLLTRCGAEVCVVADGGAVVEEALGAQADGRPYHIILMDHEMPVTDGLTATRRLRRRGYGRPIVALTAHALPEARQRCIDAGCDDYASKPLNRDTFVQLVEQWARPKPTVNSPGAALASSL